MTNGAMEKRLAKIEAVMDNIVDEWPELLTQDAIELWEQYTGEKFGSVKTLAIDMLTNKFRRRFNALRRELYPPPKD